MTDTSEQVAVPCPACSPDVAAVHEVLTPDGQSTVRCGDCGHVHKVAIEPARTVPLDVVVSQGGESFPATVEAPADERIAVGDEFVVDTEDVLMGVQVTGIEIGPEQRVDAAPIHEVETVWTRGVDNVEVNVTVHPADGRHDRTRSVTMAVPGDHRFVVGEAESVGDERFTVERVLVRNDANGYPATTLERAGDAVAAKDAKRVYGREPGRAWSAW